MATFLSQRSTDIPIRGTEPPSVMHRYLVPLLYGQWGRCSCRKDYCVQERKGALALDQADLTWPQASSMSPAVLVPRWEQREFGWVKPQHS